MYMYHMSHTLGESLPGGLELLTTIVWLHLRSLELISI